MIMRYFSLTICMFLGGLCAAQTLFVPTDHGTIQDALTAAANGDEIIVSPGIYYENLDFLGKAVRLASTDPYDPAVVASTIIDGSMPVDPNQASIVSFLNGEGPDSILEGFTLQNGRGRRDWTITTWRTTFDEENADGGAVFCRQASPTIRKNVIINNSVTYGGAGVFCHNNASPLVEDNHFENNFAGLYGAGVFGRVSCSPTIRRNTFVNNTVPTLGGAVYLADNSTSRIYDNVFIGNTCTKLFGGAIYAFVNCDIDIINNIFIENACPALFNNQPSGSAIRISPGARARILNNLFTGNICSNANGGVISFYTERSSVVANNIFAENPDAAIETLFNTPAQTITHNLFYENIDGNSAGTLADPVGQEGNIEADPRPAPNLPAPFTNYELNPDSPCIDGGEDSYLPTWVTEDFDQTPRIVRSGVDIGPQEYAALSVPTDYATIQAAVQAAPDESEIVVSPGTYAENIDLLNKNLRLRSHDPFDSNTRAGTVIDGNNTQSCIRITSGQNEKTAVAGFTITNGFGQFGGGIDVENSVGPVTMYNHIHHNSAYKPQGQTTGGYGGGIDYRWDSGGTVKHNLIEHNTAQVAGGGIHIGPRSYLLIQGNIIRYNTVDGGEAGGGIYLFSKTRADILDNEIAFNIADKANGGGIWLWEANGSTVERNLVHNNTAIASYIGSGDGGVGGGIGCLNGTTRISENLVLGNQADMGGGIWVQGSGGHVVINNTVEGNAAITGGAGLGILFNSNPFIYNNLVTGNRTGGGMWLKPSPIYNHNVDIQNNCLYQNQDGNFTGDMTDAGADPSNLFADPLLITPGKWNDNATPADPNDDFWSPGNYKIGYFSPCRDAGNAQYLSETDYIEKPRIAFGGPDIGARELQCIDLTATGSVDITDMWYFAGLWLGGTSPADIDGDMETAWPDFRAVFTSWQDCP